MQEPQIYRELFQCVDRKVRAIEQLIHDIRIKLQLVIIPLLDKKKERSAG